MAVALLTTGLLVFSVPLFAHHGNAAYDYDKKVTASGTVTDFIWANPHCWLKFDAKDENGEVKHWVVEASNPPDQTRAGWSHDSFKPGDQVTVTMIQVKNGQPIGRFVGQNQGGKIILNGKPFPATNPDNPGSAQDRSNPSATKP